MLVRLGDESGWGLAGSELGNPGWDLGQGDLSLWVSTVKEGRDRQGEVAGGKVRVHGRYKGIPVGATAVIDLDNSDYAHVDAVLDYVTIAGIPFPGWMLGKAHRQTLWLYPVPNFPGQILVHQITIDNGRLLLS